MKESMEIKRLLLPYEIDYGYIGWSSDQDKTMRSILPKGGSFEVIAFGKLLTNRNADWQRRRVSVGKSIQRCYEGQIATISDVPKGGIEKDGRIHIWAEE